MTTGADAMNDRADVLVIADDADQQRLLRFVLERARLRVSAADDRRQGLVRLREEKPKVVLCDYDLPDGGGLEVCRLLRREEREGSCYLILMSARGNRILEEAVEAGADDFLPKPFDRQEIVARVRVGLRMWALHRQLRQAAITDGLTGLYNHDHFNRVLDMELHRARRYGHPLALIMLDIDYFKAINDTFGHLAGNEALQKTARLLRESVRNVDIVGRFGGEEFAIVLPQATAEEAADVAERIRLALVDSLRVDPLHHHVVTASFGVADSDDPRVTSAPSLVDLADRALYLAKRRGRNCVALAREVDQASELVELYEGRDVEWLRRRLAVLSVQAKDVYMQSVASLLQALDERDPYTARHALNVAFYAQQLAETMQCRPNIVKAVYNAALLHDVGKVGIPDRILLKPGPLTPVECALVRQVPLIGTRIVDHLRILESEVQIIRHQREYYDGSGYPAGLKGDQIPIGARILLVADAFDAMTTDRVYRRRRSIDQALVEIHDQAGKQFDPKVVEALDEALRTRRPLWQQRIEETVRQAEQRVRDGAASVSL